MRIVIGSLNKPKNDACRNVFLKHAQRMKISGTPEFTSVEADSGIPAMPLDRQMMMRGAKNRAVHCKERIDQSSHLADFYIGLEGGIFLTYQPEQANPVVFLESWVYILNAERGHWGSSGAVSVPWELARPIVTEHRELGDVIDEWADQQNIRSRQGAVGVLTKNLVNRTDFFETALTFALSPFIDH